MVVGLRLQSASLLQTQLNVQHSFTLTSPPVQLTSSACLIVDVYTAASLYISATYAQSGAFATRLLFRSVEGTNSWNLVKIRIPTIDDVDDSAIAFVFQSMTKLTGVVAAFRSIHLVPTACPIDIPDKSALIGKFKIFLIRLLHSTT